MEAHTKVEAGTDPRAEAMHGTMTVAMLIDNYVAKHAGTIKTGKALARRLRADVLPHHRQHQAGRASPSRRSARARSNQ